MNFKQLTSHRFFWPILSLIVLLSVCVFHSHAAAPPFMLLGAGMIFNKRQDFKTISGVALGAAVQEVELTREFPIEKIIVSVSGTVGTAMTGPLADSLQNILKRVVLQVQDGGSSRTVIDASGPALLEYSKQVIGTLDRQSQAFINTNATGAFEFNYPIYFAHPQMEDPLYSSLLLPVNRFNVNPKLQLYISSQADMCGSGFALTGTLTIRVRIYRRFVDIKNWPIWNFDLIEYTQVYSAAGSNQVAFNIPTPGAYTGILVRGFPSTTTRGDILTASTGEAKLMILNNTLRRFNLSDLQAENDMSTSPVGGTGATLFLGSYYLDFLTDGSGADAPDLGSTLETASLVSTGVTPQIVADIGGAYTAKFLCHRIFGDISPLKRGR